MSSHPVYVADGKWNPLSGGVEGDFVSLGDERFYRITGYDKLAPFFMSIVSASDHWMFVSSTGALTAGRKNPDHALFPYYTVDKIHDSHGLTGGRTMLLVDAPDRRSLWEPFGRDCSYLYDIRRNLYKNEASNKLVFEEINRDLRLSFRTLWTTSERFGFVRQSMVENLASNVRTVRVLDGLQNIVPYGVDRHSQNERSTLLDAYRKNELIRDEGLALFLLSSFPIDRPEPSETLMATTAWCIGLEEPEYLLSTRQLDRFMNGETVETETDVRAQRGAFYISDDLTLGGAALREWTIVADVDRGPGQVAAIRRQLSDPGSLADALQRDIDDGTTVLRQIVAAADGMQTTADEPTTARHFSSVLFNLMRGGTYVAGYRIEKDDLERFIATHNVRVVQRNREFIRSLPETASIQQLLATVRKQEDADLARLVFEYLPLTFSRRHGDPSRPWNEFSIDVRSEDGSRILNYQGNWRDIFQNWEALSVSYPDFVESVIAKFLDASTADGYNPYRITRDGIDWERLDPTDAWSFIGYWGDHQIVYLLKLLEISRSHHPGELEQLLTAEMFAYANVPYRIKDYESLLADPHHTITFDEALDGAITERVAEIGADGRLLWSETGEVQKAGLLEKLLVPVLTKLSNFIPEAGIWMNTQRPEWNDANNALVGYGVSVVTLCHVRRFLAFLADLLRSVDWSTAPIAEEVAQFLSDITEVLVRSSLPERGSVSDRDRKRILDGLGRAGEAYRHRIYDHGFGGGRSGVSRAALLDFIDRALLWVDHSVRANRRDDGLYHAYNLMKVDGDSVSIERLYLMLEGQVAVLTSGLLSPRESIEMLDALRESDLYRSDQNSYMLYPDRRLPRFVEKNIIPQADIEASPLLTRLLADGDVSLILRDVEGVYHFSGTFQNQKSVVRALDRLAIEGYRDEVERERENVLEVFERVFNHRSYTGRSGTFFGYEGLGCIYWHMVSKLGLAAAETFERAVRDDDDTAVLRLLRDHYHAIREGIGVHKSPELYGAFPSDPYSHTPSGSGARQPGMTGQVKEDILARRIELGVVVERGRISFRPDLLSESEFLPEGGSFEYFDAADRRCVIPLGDDELGFTVCQVPVVYRKSESDRIRVRLRNDEEFVIEGSTLDDRTSRDVFARTGRIGSIQVELSRAAFRR